MEINFCGVLDLPHFFNLAKNMKNNPKTDYDETQRNTQCI